MARESELRNRVGRLLSGDYRAEDLTRLFLWLREKSLDIQSVRDIGNFVGHAEERDQGSTTEDLNNLLKLFAFQMICQCKNTPIDYSDLPPFFTEAMRGNFPRLGASTIRRHTGLKERVAYKLLVSACKKFSVIDGRQVQIEPLTEEELSVLHLCSKLLIVEPLFTDKSIFRDFIKALEKSNLLLHSDKTNLLPSRDFLSAFVLAAMHGTNIILDHGLKADLILGSESEVLKIFARCSGIVPATVLFPLFESSLNSITWCDESLIEVMGKSGIFLAETGLELNRENKLCSIKTQLLR